MKKGIKIFLIIFVILVIVVLVDTMQAKIFDNRPLIKIRYNRDGGNVDYIDKGIFVYTYVFTNGEKVTVYRWEKYAPPEEVSVDIEANKEKSFLGKIVESNESYIIVEPNENEEIRKSSDKISIGLGEYNDALYEIGTNVKITYDGDVMETYPAQIKAIKIEVKSAENFEILFKDRKPIDSYNKIYAILDKSETNKYDYTIYAYDGSVNIRIDGEEYSLKEALLQNKITMEEIIAKANKDFPDAEIYKDGGSMEYHYDNYTIIKVHKLDGNRDVYIGSKNMTINDLEI